MNKSQLMLCALLVCAPWVSSQPAVKAGGTQARLVFHEEATFKYTRPIPLDGTPLGCQVRVVERICRTDKLRVTWVEVISKTFVGASSLDSATADRGGCALVRATVGVEKSTDPTYKCVGGDASIDLRLLLKSAGSVPPKNLTP